MQKNNVVRENWRIFKRKKQVLTGYTAMVAMAGLIAANANVAMAAPTNGMVQSGNADISLGKDTVIDQHTSRIDVQWDTFSTKSDESITFNQVPTDVAINRVIGGQESSLAGKLSAAGSIYIMNSAGVTFTGSSQVNVGALIATTATGLDIDGDKYNFTGAGEGSIINEGNIAVSNGGFAVLAAPYVENSGAIVADLGQIHLASTNNFTVDLRGDNLVTFTVSQESLNKIGVKNTGTLQAKSGLVAISTQLASDIVESNVNLGGVIDASALEAGKNGGSVLVSSVGNISNSANINVDGGVDSNGGSIITKADGLNDLTADGFLSAKGGTDAGNGGFIEVSGNDFNLEGGIDASAANGDGGLFYLDPDNITIKNGNGILGFCGANTVCEKAIENLALLGISTSLNATNSITVNDISDNTIDLTGGLGSLFANFSLTAPTITFLDTNDTVKTGLGNITLAAVTTLTGGNLHTDGGNITITGGNLTAGNLTIDNGVGGTSTLKIDSTGNVTTGNIDVSVEDTTFLLDDANAVVDIDAVDNVHTGSITVSATDENLSVRNASATLDINTTANNDDEDNITVNGDINVTALATDEAGGDATADAHANLTASQGSITTKNVTVTRTATVDGDADNELGGDITITSHDTANNDDINTGNLTASRDVLVNGGDGINLGNIDAGRDVTAHASDQWADESLTTGTIEAGRNVDLFAGSDVTTDAITAGNDVTIKSHQATVEEHDDSIGNVLVQGKIDADGNVLIESDGNITTQAVDPMNITMTAAGNIGTGILAASNDILLTAGGNVTVTGSATAGIDATIHAGGNVLAQDVTATDGNVDIDGGIASGTVDTDNVTSGGSIDVNAGGNITHTGDVKTTGAAAANKNITVASTSGSIHTTGSILGGNDVTLDAGKNVLIAYAEAAHDLFITADDDITSDNLKSGNNTTLNSGTGSGDDISTGKITAGGNVVANAGGNITTGAIDPYDITLTAGGNITTGALTATHNIDVHSDKDVNVSGDITGDNDVTIKALGGSIFTLWQDDAHVGNVTATNGNLTIISGGYTTAHTLTAGNNIDVDAGLGISTWDIHAGNNVDLDTLGSVTTNGNKITAGGNVDIDALLNISTGDVDPYNISMLAGGNINTGALAATHNITLNSLLSSVTTGDITITNTYGDSSTLDIDAHKNVTTGTINVSVNDTTVPGIDAEAYVDIDAGKDVSTKAITVTANDHEGTARNAVAHLSIDGRNVTIDGDTNVTATSGRGFFTHAATADAGAEITATTGSIVADNITVSRTATGYGHSVTGGDLTLKAGDDITTNNLKASRDISVTAGTGSNDDVTTGSINAGNDVGITAGGNVNTDGNTGGVFEKITALGNVTVGAGGNIHTGDIDPVDVTLTADGSITTATITASNDISAHAGGDIVTGNVDAGHDITFTAGNNITVNDINEDDNSNVLTADNDISLTAGDHLWCEGWGTITVNGNTIAGDDVSFWAGNNVLAGNLIAGTGHHSNITVTAYDGSIETYDQKAGGNISDTASEDVTTTNLDAGHDVTISSGDDTTVNGKTTAGHDVEMTAGGAITTGDIDPQHITLTAWGNILTGDLSASRDITVTSNHGDITTGSIDIENLFGDTSTLTLDAFNDLTVDGDITVFVQDNTVKAKDAQAIAHLTAGDDITIGVWHDDEEESYLNGGNITVTALDKEGDTRYANAVLTMETVLRECNWQDEYPSNITVNGDIDVSATAQRGFEEEYASEGGVHADAYTSISSLNNVYLNGDTSTSADAETNFNGDAYAHSTLEVSTDEGEVAIDGQTTTSAEASTGYGYAEAEASSQFDVGGDFTITNGGNSGTEAEAYGTSAYATSAWDATVAGGISQDADSIFATAEAETGQSEETVSGGNATAASELYQIAQGDITITSNLLSTAEASTDVEGDATAGADLTILAGYAPFWCEVQVAGAADLNITGDIITDADAYSVNGDATAEANTDLEGTDDVTITTADHTISTTATAYAANGDFEPEEGDHVEEFIQLDEGGSGAGDANANANLYIYAGDHTAKGDVIIPGTPEEVIHHEAVICEFAQCDSVGGEIFGDSVGGAFSSGDTIFAAYDEVITPGTPDETIAGDHDDNDLIINGHTLVEANATTEAGGTPDEIGHEGGLICGWGGGCDSSGNQYNDSIGGDYYGYGDTISEGEDYVIPGYPDGHANAYGTAFLGADNNVTLNGDTEVNAGAFTEEGGDASATAWLDGIAGLGTYNVAGLATNEHPFENGDFTFGDVGDFTINGAYGTHAVDSGSNESIPVLSIAHTLAAAPAGNGLYLNGPAPYAIANNQAVIQYFTGFDAYPYEGSDYAELILRDQRETSSSSSSSSGGSSSSSGSSSSGGDTGSSGSSSGVINPPETGDNPAFNDIISVLIALRAQHDKYESPEGDIAPAAGDDVEGQYCQTVNTSNSNICSKKGDTI